VRREGEMWAKRFEMVRSRREGRDGGGCNLSISVEGLVRIPIYPFIMVVTETECTGKGEAKRRFNICFAWTSKILNIRIAHQFVLGDDQRYIVAAKDFPLIRYRYKGYSVIRNYSFRLCTSHLKLIMSTSHCILLDHAHIGDQHIPSFVDSIRLVLQDYEHITLHTP
jgi:hypothetical protein